ncbi:MAG TPA: hypothetical protein PLP81_11140, partial [Saprospiraceae bacterium]|nr:hypothetical protein [Saprospiraceae bacterium]
PEVGLSNGRDYLKGVAGDRINLLMATAAWNLKQRSEPHFSDRFLRSYFPTYQPAFCSLTDS